MLVTLSEILEMAEKKNFAVGAFNTPNLECLLAVLHNAEELNIPIVISHAELHEDIAPLEDIGPVLLCMAKASGVPVCVHLDHGEHLSYLEKALDMGFTSVMYDGSLLSYEDNIANTRKAVEMASRTGASVEAELGVMGGREAGAAGADAEEKAGDFYTDPETAKAFVRETGIHALAASFGTAHGIYKIKPALDFGRIRRIRELTGIPLVMHGGSGVSPEDYRRAIDRGVRKINYYSYMSNAGMKAARELLSAKETVFYHDIAFAAQMAMKEDTMRAMKVFYDKGD